MQDVGAHAGATRDVDHPGDRGVLGRIRPAGDEVEVAGAAGVDESGRLLLDTLEGRVAVLAGDVSLRMKGA